VQGATVGGGRTEGGLGRSEPRKAGESPSGGTRSAAARNDAGTSATVGERRGGVDAEDEGAWTESD
jgi:hypothetical protein